MMDMNGFLPATKTNFPVEECVIESKHHDEVGIFESHENYLCCIIDTNNKNRLIFMNLSPFIQKIDGHSYYGWYDTNDDSVWFDNMENRVNEGAISDYYVAGFIKMITGGFDPFWQRTMRIIKEDEERMSKC